VRNKICSEFQNQNPRETNFGTQEEIKIWNVCRYIKNIMETQFLKRSSKHLKKMNPQKVLFLDKIKVESSIFWFR
jgi:hypothetical protein